MYNLFYFFCILLRPTSTFCRLLVLFFLKFFYTTKYIHCIMSELTVDVLSEICSKLPKDFIVEFANREGIRYSISDIVEVDVSGKKIVLKS